jgi:hypothetical protein
VSDGVHLLIPFAGCAEDGCREALRDLRLPNLSRLLGRWREEPPDLGSAQSLSPPHERALARLRGWPSADGLVPLAAWDALQAGLPGTEGAWARFVPCHWRVGADHVAMADPDELQLDEATSRAALAAMNAFFEEDGLTLHYRNPLLWLAQGPLVAGLPTASLDRVIGRNIDPWMPRSQAARPLRRLQQETQMLLYTAPLNDERQSRGLLPVNSFWVSGTGPWPAHAHTANEPRIAAALRAPALRQDWAAWSAAWEQLDAGLGDPALTRITLCGESHARTWVAGAPGLARRLRTLWRPPTVAATLESL